MQLLPLLTRAGFLLLACLLVSACAFDNRATCKLPAGVSPLPPCHTGSTLHWDNAGEPFPYSLTRPAGQPRGAVIVLPGWDSVACDFEPLASALAARGWAVYAMELRCQRYDPKPARRGNPHDWQAWVKDAKGFIRFVAARTPKGAPIFIQGQSFGTIIGINAAAELQAEIPLRGMVLQSPAMAMMRPKVEPATALATSLLPWLRFAQVPAQEKQGLDLTTDPEWNCRWLHSADRLPEGYKLRFMKLATDLGGEAWRRAPELRMPVLALRGGDDPFAKAQFTQPGAYDEFLDSRLPASRREIAVYPHGKHLLTAGRDRARPIADIVRWIERHSR